MNKLKNLEHEAQPHNKIKSIHTKYLRSAVYMGCYLICSGVHTSLKMEISLNRSAVVAVGFRLVVGRSLTSPVVFHLSDQSFMASFILLWTWI